MAIVIAAPAIGHAQGHRSHDTSAHAEHGKHTDEGALGIPASRFGSGTSWLADDSPVRALERSAGAWHVMFHGAVFAGYDEQTSDAGDGELVSQNWAMAMAARPLGGGRLQLRGMASLEPLTVGDSYPLLLQTGELDDGMPLVDRQHPHDLVMEASASYARPITNALAFELYAALAGEPALGPVAFMHRPSSFANPFAPLGHHMQDATHISFGVLTAGLFTRDIKLEASWFNGREPDDDRYDVELRTPDSYAARASFNPSRAVSLSAAYGYLESPDAREPDVSMRRFTYAITHAMRLGGRRNWTSTGAVGQNFPSEGRMTHSVLAETALDLDRGGTTFLRFEEMGKSGHDFGFEGEMADADILFGTFTLGHVHPVLRVADLETALGVLGSIAYVDDVIEARYGTRTPVGAMVYVQLVPVAH